jgi:uncharacterized membrane protein
MAAHADSRPLVLVAALFALSVAAYLRLPPATVDRAFIAFLLPTAAGVVYVLMHLLAAHDHVRSGNGAFAQIYDAIVFRLVLFIAALHATVLVGLLGQGLAARTGPVVPRLAPLLLGTGLMAVGNLLPRVKPNVAIGIRTTRTLSDREAWLRANRIAGYVAVALGFGIVVSALLLPPGQRVAVAVGSIGMAGLVTLVAWTWRSAYGRSEAAR